MPEKQLTMAEVVELRKRARAPEQQRVYEEVQARNRLIQDAKIPPPKSGIFGRPPKDKS